MPPASPHHIGAQTWRLGFIQPGASFGEIPDLAVKDLGEDRFLVRVLPRPVGTISPDHVMRGRYDSKAAREQALTPIVLEQQFQTEEVDLFPISDPAWVTDKGSQPSHRPVSWIADLIAGLTDTVWAEIMKTFRPVVFCVAHWKQMVGTLLVLSLPVLATALLWLNTPGWRNAFSLHAPLSYLFLAAVLVATVPCLVLLRLLGKVSVIGLRLLARRGSRVRQGLPATGIPQSNLPRLR